MISKSASLALLPLLLVACGQATSVPAADDPELTTSPTLSTPHTPSPSAPQSSSTTRPLDDFPLARGYPETNGNDGSPVEVTDTSGIEKLVFCHEAGWTPAAPVPPVDLVGTTYTGEAEDHRGRTLARYADAEEAELVVSYLRRAVEVCPADDGRVHDITPRQVGDGAFLVMLRYRGEYGFSTGLTLLDVVRVGDLLLLNQRYGEGGGSLESIRWSVHDITSHSDDLLAEMCAIAQPCPAEGIAPPPANPELVIGPDGIRDLALGMTSAAAAEAGLLGEPRHDGSGCTVVWREDADTTITADIQPGFGVVMLRATGSVTPEGIGPGSSTDDVMTEYPRATGDEAMLSTPVPGHPANAYWFWMTPQGRVDDVTLIRPDRRCYG